MYLHNLNCCLFTWCWKEYKYNVYLACIFLPNPCFTIGIITRYPLKMYNVHSCSQYVYWRLGLDIVTVQELFFHNERIQYIFIFSLNKKILSWFVNHHTLITNEIADLDTGLVTKGGGGSWNTEKKTFQCYQFYLDCTLFIL